MVMTEDKKEELAGRFKAMYEAHQAIEMKKEDIKAFTTHIRETVKALAETLEVKQKTIKEAYKIYVNSIENPEEESEKNEILALLQEYNLLGLDKEE